MSKNKKIIILIISILVLLLSSFTIYYYFNNKTTNKEKQNSTQTIGIFEDGTYYINDAPKTIKFQIRSKSNKSYKLTDENNKQIKSKVIKIKGKNYITSNNYKSGKTYTLTLKHTKFISKSLKKAEKLKFKITEPEKAKYKLTDKTIIVDKKNIKKQKDNKLKINTNKKIKENDVILVNNKNTTNEAYKVKEINKNIITYEKPEIKDIYKDIDLYTKGKVNFNNIKLNKDIKAEFIKKSKNSSAFNFLTTVYAEEEIGKPKFSIKAEGNQMTIEVEFSFKANNKEKMGIKALKTHDLTIKFTYTLSANYQAKIDLGSAISFDVVLESSSKINVNLSSKNEVLKGIENISDKEYSKSVTDIIEKLEKEPSDDSSSSVYIGAVSVPTPIIGVNVYFDVYFQHSLSVVTNIKSEFKNKTTEHIGFIIDKNGLDGYKNISNDSDFSLDITGKEEARIGIGLDVGINIINKDIAHAEMGIESGLYFDAFVMHKINFTTKTKNINQDLLASAELGIYLKPKIEVSVNLLFKTLTGNLDLKEITKPILNMGNSELISSITTDPETLVIEDNNKVSIPQVNKVILNIKTNQTRQEQCNMDNVYFEDENQNKLQNNSKYITLPSNKDMTIYAVYKNGGNKYKKEIKVLKQGSTITNEQSIQANNDGTLKGLSINNNTPAINAYRKYIKEKRFLDDYKEFIEDDDHTVLKDVGYCIFDINQDQIPELIIDAKDGGINNSYLGWNYDIIYTYINNKVTKVEVLFAFGGISYDVINHEICYSDTRPTSVTGGYGFYKLEKDKLIYTKTVGHDRGSIIDGEYQYDNHIYYDAKTDTTKYITEDEEYRYFDNNKEFAFKDINSV